MEKHVEKRSFSIRSAFNALVIIMLISVIGVVSIFYDDRPTVSEIEKRELAKMPEFSVSLLINGQYAKQISSYFADTFPAREQFVKLASTIKENRGFHFNSILLYAATTEDSNIDTELPILPDDSTTSDVNANLTKDSQQSIDSQPNAANNVKTDTEDMPSASSESETNIQSSSIDSTSSMSPVEEGVRMGAIFIYKGSGYTIFGGSDKMGQWYAQVLNTYESVLGDHIRIYNLVVPTSIEFNLPSNYQSVTTPQKPKLENIAACLDSGIEWVDVYQTLFQHKNEYLYYRTDHHWSTLGAYYAYEQFAEAAGFEPVPLKKMEKRTLNNFLGTLYSQTQNSKMASNPDHVDYFIMPTAYKCYQYRKGSPYTSVRIPLYGEYAKTYNSYSVFMHGDFPVTVIDTEIKNGRRIAVVKESYGNAFIPFLVNHYETIVVIDQRYLEKNFYDVLNEFEVNELLFINNIAAAHTTVRIQELASLPNRIYIPPEPSSEPENMDDKTSSSTESGQEQEKS